MKANLHTLNPTTKMLVLLLVGLLFYIAIFSLLKPFFLTEPTPIINMMRQMAGNEFLRFSSGSSTFMNTLALIMAVAAMGILSYFLFQEPHLKEPQTIYNQTTYDILRQALSDDEQAILDQIYQAGEVTQDSLRFRLNWSKAKVSTILTNLDKRNLIQRERVGKTYKVYPNKQFKTV